LNEPDIKSVVVIGAGYISVEIAEAVRRRGKEALLFEAMDTCLANYYDDWFSKDMDQVLADNGISLHYLEMVQEIKGDTKVKGIKTDKGEYPVDMVIMAIGFKPNTSLAGKNKEKEGFIHIPVWVCSSRSLWFIFPALC
jgi:NADPH-dependent 2,4-dienoyl-CoA reductase/sulfur reductase-like enzyme